MDAVDIAIGNLLGSNIFNMLILAVDDFFYTDGPLLSHASGNNIISAVSAIAMTAVVVIGLTYRVERKRLFMAWDSLAIVLIYISNIMVLYMVR
jgi:cation:H+ antiporter